MPGAELAARIASSEQDADMALHRSVLTGAGSERLTVSRITLSNFRNYESQRLVCGEEPVIIMGSNGSGKTNLIEALSLLVPGKGLRRSALSDLQNRHRQEPWAVSVDLRAGDLPVAIGTGVDKSGIDGEDEKRSVHIDGKPVRSQSALSEHVVMAWITPDMDRLLSEGASTRRKFLDRLAFAFDPAHGGRVQRYEKAMRERLRILREGGTDAAWLSALEDEMARTAVAIAATRRHMILRLRSAIEEGGHAFPRADIAVRGTAEDMLDDKPALLVEDALRAAFVLSRQSDAASGCCATGAHRSDLKVSHRAHNCPAELCSTGEQKALMIALMLAYVRLLAEQRRTSPLFLLDDIVAHLDDFRRAALFDELMDIGGQAWLTGADSASFSRISAVSQMFYVENGTIFG